MTVRNGAYGAKTAKLMWKPSTPLLGIVEHYDSALKRLKRQEQRLAEAEKFQVRSLAAKEIDKAWRSRSMVPVCPSCRSGLFPEDFKNGIGMMDRDFARKRAAAKSTD